MPKDSYTNKTILSIEMPKEYIPRPVFNVAPVLNLTPSEIGYLAGIIDGEGSIYMSKYTHPNGQIEMHLKVEITNTDQQLMNWIKSKLGSLTAFFVDKRTRNPNHKINHHAVITEIGSVHTILSSILNNLIIKRERAELVLKYTSRRIGMSKYHTRYSEEDKLIYEELRRMNRKGKEENNHS